MTELSEAVASLSARELEVLTLLADGKRNIEIAAAIGVKPRTISQFKARAAEKLGLDHPSDVALVDAARTFGVFKPPREEVPTEVVVTSNLPVDLFEISLGFPGKFTEVEWLRADPLVKRLMAEGIALARLCNCAVMYRRQHAAQTSRAIEELIATGLDPDVARRRAKPIPITTPEKFFAGDGPWQGRFPLPAFIEVPPEPVPGDGM